jgi:putrescine importer
MGVSAATIRRFYFASEPGHKPRLILDAVFPAMGFLFCMAIWLSLPLHAKILGGVWFVLGIAYDGAKTKGFRRSPPIYDLAGI